MQIKPSPIDIEATMGAVNAAMEFVSYAHRKGHPYTGTVRIVNFAKLIW